MYLAAGLLLLVGSVVLTILLRPRSAVTELSDTGAVAAALTISGGIAIGTGMTIAFFL